MTRLKLPIPVLLTTFLLGFAQFSLHAQCLVSDTFNNEISPSWSVSEIGAATGGATVLGSALTLTSTDPGMPGGVGTVSDSFYYLYQSSTGDPEVTLQIDTMPSTSGALLGLMFRNSPDAGDVFAFVGASTTSAGSGKFFMMSRIVPDGDTSFNTIGGNWTNGSPVYVRMVKAGSSFNAYYSIDGSAWSNLTTVSPNFNSSPFEVGVALASANTITGDTGSVSNFNVLSGFCTPTPTLTLTPSPSPTATPSPTNSITDTFTLTQTPTFTLTQTPTDTTTFTTTPTPYVLSVATVTGTPADSTQIPGTQNVGIMQFSVNNPGTAGTTIFGFVLQSVGDGAQISEVNLLQGGVGGSPLVSKAYGGSGLVTLGGGPLTVLGNGTVTYGVSYNFQPNASTGSYSVSLTGLRGLDDTGQVLQVNGAPLGGAMINIVLPTSTPTATPTATLTTTPTYTLTDTSTFTKTETQTFTETPTPTDTLTWTQTQTPIDTPTFTQTATPTFTQTATPTDTQTATPTFTQTATPTETQTATPTDTPTATATFTQTATPTFTQTETPTFTQTATPTFTQTATTTSTATVTPTVALALSWNNQPVSQTYLFNQTNVSSLQLVLTSTAQENVVVKQLAFTGGGSLNWSTDVVAGSVRLYQDASGNGLYSAGTDTLLMGGQSFNASGSVTFQNVNGVTAPLASGAPQTFLLVFDLNMSGLATKNFSNLLANSGITANGQTTGQAAILSGGPVGGILHTVSAATATPTVTTTSTPTATATFTQTATPTDTQTATPTHTQTETPTFSQTATPTTTPTFTQTATSTDTPTATQTFTQTATPTDTLTWTQTQTPTDTPTFTQTATPTFTQTATPTDTQTATPTFTQTATPTETQTATPTDTPTATATFTQTATPTFTQTETPTFTQTATPTFTQTATTTSTATVTPTVALALSWNNQPVSQTYLFNQTNVSSLQLVLTSTAQENVVVKQLAFTGGGSLNWSTDVVAGSVRLYQDASGNGLYSAGTDTLLMGGQSFNASGSVTFQNVNGVTAPLASGAPQTFLLVFDLNMSGLATKNFSNLLANSGITANGQTTGQAAILSGGPVGGILHTVSAATATPTVTTTSTPTATATFTQTATPTDTQTATPTHTQTETPTFSQTATPTTTPTFTQTATSTDTPTATQTFTQTATPTDTLTWTQTQTPTDTPTFTQTATPTFTQTATPTDTQTATPTFTQTATPTETQTATPTDTPTATATFTQTATPTFTQTETPTFTQTATPTFTQTATTTSTATVTPTVALALSWNNQPVSQTYLFNQTNVSSLQLVLTSTAQENVVVKQLAFTGGGSLNWSTDVVAGSVRLYQDASGNGLYSAGTDTLLMGGQSFNASGSVTFQNVNGVTAPLASGAPQTFLLVFDLNMSGLATKNFSNLLANSGITANGQTTGQAAILSGGPVGGILHTVSAATATPTVTTTSTPTATATFTQTATLTFTQTATLTFTQTQTPTDTQTATQTFTQTATPTFTQTATPTDTPTATATFTQTATPTDTQTATPTFTQTATPTFTQTATPTDTPTATATFTQTATPTFTQTATQTFTQTATPTFTQTQTPTFTQTATPTQTQTATTTSTATVTPTVALALSWNNQPASQTYLFNQNNVSSVQFILESTAQENVLVKQLVLTGGGSLGWSTDVVAGSVRLYQDASGNGLYSAGTDTLLMGGQSFNASGSVTFQNVNGVTAPLVSGAPQTFLIIFDLNMTGLTTKNFSNSLAVGGITANGQTTGQAAILSGGPITGNLHTVSAATATPTVTTTSTPTSTPTFTQTQTPTFTQTATPTFTQTQTPTDTPTYTQTTTPTFTQTYTPTFTQTATPTDTQTATQTYTQTATPTFTQTATPTVTQTHTATFTQTATPTDTQTATTTSTQTATPTATQTHTPTFTQTATPTVTATFTQTATTTSTATVTPTPTATFQPPVSLAILPVTSSLIAGPAGAPLTVEALNTSGFPATLQTALTLSLTSTSTGQNAFSFSSAGAPIQTVNLLAGSVAQAQVYYSDYKAGTWNLTLSGSGYSAASTLVTVIPGPYNGLQVLLPGQTADPGQPTADHLGRIGNPAAQAAGSPVQVTLNAVDAYFNPITSNNDFVTLVSSDPAMPAGGSVNLVNGTGSKPVTFYSPGNQSVTATDGTKNGVSDLLTVQGGTTSTLLNVVHNSPALSGQGLGAVGVTFMTFRLTVGSGTDPIQLNNLVVHARDSNGTDVPFNTALQSLSVSSGSQTIVTSMTTVNSAIVTLGAFPTGTFLVNPGTPVTLVLSADISSGATASSLSLSLDAAGSVAAIDSVSPFPPVAVVSSGDPTGFPMSSGVLILEPADVAKTFGNYPNPFRPDVENTTIEFYLPAPANVSLVLYDVLGNKVLTLLNSQNLPAGLQREIWTGRNGVGSQVLSGVYYAQLTVNGTNYLLKVAVVK